MAAASCRAISSLTASASWYEAGGGPEMISTM
jgi:hypothetical protein